MAKISLKALPEIFVSNVQMSKAVGEAVAKGELRKLGSRLYTCNLEENPERLIRRNRQLDRNAVGKFRQLELSHNSSSSWIKDEVFGNEHAHGPTGTHSDRRLDAQALRDDLLARLAPVLLDRLRKRASQPQQQPSGNSYSPPASAILTGRDDAQLG